MADNIQIDSGIKRITVNGDANRVIQFNPQDVLFVEKFYNLIKVFETKEEEYRTRASEIQENIGKSADDVPVNTPDAIDLIKDICVFLREQIDAVFGEGTSQAAFGDTNTLWMFEQFFDGITPFIRQTRAGKSAKYITGKKEKS